MIPDHSNDLSYACDSFMFGEVEDERSLESGHHTVIINGQQFNPTRENQLDFLSNHAKDFELWVTICLVAK